MPGEFEREIAIEILSGKEFQRQLATDAARLQVRLDVQERMLGKQQIRGPIRRDDKRAHRIKLARQISQKIDSRNISPMKIIEEDHERPVFGEFLKQRAEFPFHSLL